LIRQHIKKRPRRQCWRTSSVDFLTSSPSSIIRKSTVRESRLSAGTAYDRAVDAAIVAKARPILFTSLMLASAFLCYLFSSFMPVFYLGALTALTMVGAGIGSLVLLPALLRVFRPGF
jgi:predicted RND superfamily exporter protein